MRFIIVAANLIAGALTPLALAPTNAWPIALITLAIFNGSLALIGRGYFINALAFGIGLFGTGASWVYVSIHNFGLSSAFLALVLTSIFVFGLALVFALPYSVFRFFKSPSDTFNLCLVAPAFWLFGEWLRGWFLTGFPWLYLGYSHLNSPLSGLAPIGGVLLISFAIALSASLLTWLLLSVKNKRWQPALVSLVAIAAIWLGAGATYHKDWTRDLNQTVDVGLVQANIAQEDKWQPDFRLATLELFDDMSEPLWAEVDWVVWPEAALPMLYEHAEGYLNEISRKAAAHNSALITGILYRSPNTSAIYNSIMARGLGQGLYYKTRLVPFGEYMPLESWLRGTLAFFDLPTSIITPGSGPQSGLQVGQWSIAANICYEVVYPTLVAESAHSRQALLTISNDGWFGDSIGPLQHMQMAQMRALETGRYLIRATNNGMTGVIDNHGQLVASLPQFSRQSLISTVKLFDGDTPYMTWRNLPIYLILLSILLSAWLWRYLRTRGANKASA